MGGTSDGADRTLRRSARPNRPGALAVAVALLTAACTGSGEADPQPSPTAPAAGTTTPGRGAPAEGDVTVEELRARLTPPALPSFTIPTDVLADTGNQRIAEDLDVLPGLYRDIAVLDAYCDPAGDAAAADTGGTPDPGWAGSAQEGAVEVTVVGDGTGVYDAPGLHIAVLPGGAGVYDDGETRLSVSADGTGTYESGDLRVFVRPDGSGTFEDHAGDDALRVWIDPDGSGSYRGPEGRVTVDAQGRTGGNADPAVAAVVAQVLRAGLPPFPPVPRITRVEPVGESCGTVVRLDAGVLFGFDSDELQPGGRELLQRVAGLLGTLGSPGVDVVGHTDSSGDEAYNEALSQRRASAVTDELVSLGAAREALRPVGRGEQEPVRPDTGPDGTADPAAQQLNRRVELVLRDAP